MNFACRPYHTFHGDLTCPSQTDYLNSISILPICISLHLSKLLLTLLKNFTGNKLIIVAWNSFLLGLHSRNTVWRKENLLHLYLKGTRRNFCYIFSSNYMMYTFTFHAKHEGALRLMLIKCIAFHLSTDL